MKYFFSLTTLFITIISTAQHVPYENDKVCYDTELTEEWSYLGPPSEVSESSSLLGLIPQLGIVNAVALHPDYPDVLFAGSNTSGIFKTQDGGENWYSVTDAMGFSGLGVESIAIDPNDPNIMYATTGAVSNDYGGWCLGIIKSIDAGESWFSTVDYTGENLPTEFGFRSSLGFDVIKVDPVSRQHKLDKSY